MIGKSDSVVLGADKAHFLIGNQMLRVMPVCGTASGSPVNLLYLLPR
jgi:hypothetical protein